MSDFHLIDAEAAGELLAVPRTWLLAQARADRVPHIRLGRYVRFDPHVLAAWAAERQRGPVSRNVSRKGEIDRNSAQLSDTESAL